MSEKKASPQAEQQTVDNPQQSSNKKDNLLHKYSFAAILIVAAIILAAASSWLSYRFHHNVGALAEDVEKLSTHVDQLQQQMTQQHALLKKVEATNDTLRARLVARDNPARWQIAEALYFTRLANDSLQFHHDINTGKQLLTLADDRLRSSGESGVAPIRQSLTQIIDQLHALPQVDVVGVYSQLNALADSVTKLTPLPEVEALKKKAAEAGQSHGAGEPAKTSSWRQGLSHSMKRVWQLIIIQRRDQAIAPLLTNQQYQQLNNTLLLLIRQAQWAVLYRQSTIYHDSLHQLTTLLKHYYGGNSQQVKPLLAEISQLDNMKIDVTPPSLSSLIDAITQYLNQQPASSFSRPTSHAIADTAHDTSQSVQQQVNTTDNTTTTTPSNSSASNTLAITMPSQGDKVAATATKTSDDNRELSI